MTWLRALALVVAVLAAVPAVAARPPAIEALDARLQAAAAKGFGGAVVIERDGKPLLAKGYGFANREERHPFTVNTIAQVGSITKTFTGLALAQLVAAHRVSLNATLGTYVPDAPEPVRSSRIGQLVGHRAGLSDACGEDFDAVDEAHFLSHCLAMPLEFPVGENHYSNMGYSLLALVVQRVSGEPWEAYLRRHIWAPLGMRDTGFSFAERRARRFAVGYLNNQPQGVISDRIGALDGANWNLRGNGGIQASARDMMRLVNALVDGRRGLDPAARALMLRPVGAEEDHVAEGFGLFFRSDESGKPARVGHSGSDGTFFSYVGWLPRNGIRFYFVGNNGEDHVKPILRDVLTTVSDLPPKS